MSEHDPQEADGKQSSTHYRWAVSSHGYMLTGRAFTEIHPSEDSFLHVFMDAAEAQARRDGIPFDPFNSDIRVVPDGPNRAPGDLRTVDRLRFVCVLGNLTA